MYMYFVWVVNVYYIICTYSSKSDLSYTTVPAFVSSLVMIDYARSIMDSFLVYMTNLTYIWPFLVVNFKQIRKAMPQWESIFTPRLP